MREKGDNFSFYQTQYFRCTRRHQSWKDQEVFGVFQGYGLHERARGGHRGREQTCGEAKDVFKNENAKVEGYDRSTVKTQVQLEQTELEEDGKEVYSIYKNG